MTDKFRLEKYEAKHAYTLFDGALRDGETLDVSKLATLKEIALWREKSGAAFTLFMEDRIVGCGGVDIEADIARTWLLLSDLANKYPKYVTRVVKTTLAGIIREFGLTQLIAEVEPSDGKAILYITALGFSPTGKSIDGADGRKYLLYRRAA